MVDKLRLQEIMAMYKTTFDTRWEHERHKWEILNSFQKNWDIDAADFGGMLTRSFSNVGRYLITTRSRFSVNPILFFAEKNPEEVRWMFRSLFNEEENVSTRLIEFRQHSTTLYSKYGGNWSRHAQTENVISTYLWLRFPDKHYIYKPETVRIVANKLSSKLTFRYGKVLENITNFYALYDDIRFEIKKDIELMSIFRAKLTSDYYPDPECRTLTTDIGFYIQDLDLKKNGSHEKNWFPIAYSPKLSVENWIELLSNKKVFNAESLEIMRRMQDHGGKATCKQLSEKYGKDCNFYNRGSTSLAQRVVKETQCPKPPDRSNAKWWPILYIGKCTNKKNEGNYIWKLRNELAEALEKVDLSHVSLYSKPTQESNHSKISYCKTDFLKDVYMTENRYDRLVSMLKRKKNIILQGAPGVGKTYIAKRLAYSIMEKKDEDKIEFIQFHQNYSYEDFMMGYKPVDNGFALKEGVFYRFCQKAIKTQEKEHFFIVDEINRGNMSKIFGELLMLIEHDYRGIPATLAYDGRPFAVPDNLYIIGMMNTADRSLAMIDYALRRRFSFFNIEPGFDSSGFQKYQQNLNSKTFDSVISKIKKLNYEIENDPSLGKAFCIGHSYFCGQEKCSEEWLQSIVEYDILPMLSEYWFDDLSKLQYWENILIGTFR